jgi:hypothetical protein
MKKIILFATSPQDAMQWCEEHSIEFSDIIWVLGPSFLADESVYTDAQGVAYEPDYESTYLFSMSDMYVEARKLLK